MSDSALVTHSNSVAIGANSQSTAVIGAGYGIPSGSITPTSSVSFGSPTEQRRLTNVAAGQQNTDAVNVSQLKQLHGDLATVVGVQSLLGYHDGYVESASFSY